MGEGWWTLLNWTPPKNGKKYIYLQLHVRAQLVSIHPIWIATLQVVMWCSCGTCPLISAGWRPFLGDWIRSRLGSDAGSDKKSLWQVTLYDRSWNHGSHESRPFSIAMLNDQRVNWYMCVCEIPLSNWWCIIYALFIFVSNQFQSILSNFNRRWAKWCPLSSDQEPSFMNSGLRSNRFGMM